MGAIALITGVISMAYFDRTKVYWQDHYIGSTTPRAMSTLKRTAPYNGDVLTSINRVDIPDSVHIREVACLAIEYDKDFCELFGITGVNVE